MAKGRQNRLSPPAVLQQKGFLIEDVAVNAHALQEISLLAGVQYFFGSPPESPDNLPIFASSAAFPVNIGRDYRPLLCCFALHVQVGAQ